MRDCKAAAIVLAAMMTLATAGLARAAGGEPTSGAPFLLPLDGVVTNPDWLKKPNGDEIAREYPPLAQLMKLSGVATVTCTAETDGRLDDCHIDSEWPAGLGFGAATLRATAYFTMKPATRDGKPIAASVTIPLRFLLAGVSAAAPDAATISPPTSPGALVAARRVVALQDMAGRLRAKWRLSLDRMAAQVVLSGEAQSSAAALDAFRSGLEETIAGAAERRAQLLAARMTEAELTATAAYLQTAAGRAWVQADVVVDTMPDDFMNRLAVAARSHLCTAIDCGMAGASAHANDSR